jgi:hypothetical protein
VRVKLRRADEQELIALHFHYLLGMRHHSPSYTIQHPKLLSQTALPPLPTPTGYMIIAIDNVSWLAFRPGYEADDVRWVLGEPN